MSNGDLVNSGFELVGGILVWTNVRRLLRDREVRGVCYCVQAFFAAFGTWSAFFYASLAQHASLFAALVLASGNITWVILAMRFAWRPKCHRRMDHVARLLARGVVSSEAPVICTASGKYVSPLYLRADDVCIEDIAHSLANQCRFSGHTREFFSVAQHCVTVSYLVPPALALDGLMHDASEYVLQDCPRPLKEHAAFGPTYRAIERRAERVIADVFGLAFPHPPEVKAADLCALAAERRDLMPAGVEWEVLRGVVPASEPVIPWPPVEARAKFLTRYFEVASTIE